MKNIKLGGPFFCPRCQCIHSSAMTCEEIQALKKHHEDFFDNLRETTEEEKRINIDEVIEHCKEQAKVCNIKKCADDHLQLAEWLEELKELRKLFTLDESEVIVVEHFLTCDKKKLETYEPSQENDIMIGDLNHILNKIKQWRDENNKPT